MGFAFRPLAESDLGQLAGWLAEPHVARWWRDPADPAAVRAAWLPRLAGGPVEGFVALHDGAPAGFVQLWHDTHEASWLDDPEGASGIDVLLGEPGLLKRRLGREMVRAFAAFAFARDPGCRRLVADPHPDNWAAIICLKKAGFREKGRVQTPDGPAMLLALQRHLFKP